MYAFRIFRLVVIATLITYMIGCAWWSFSLITNTEALRRSKDTFITRFGLDQLYLDKG